MENKKRLMKVARMADQLPVSAESTGGLVAARFPGGANRPCAASPRPAPAIDPARCSAPP
jgi:hypothetical protein